MHDQPSWDPPTAQAKEILWRHGHWIKRREAIRSAMVNSTRPSKRLQRWDACGAFGVVEYSMSRNKARVTCWHCHDRLCQPCMAARRRDINNIVINNTKNKRARLITLTLKHREAPLKSEMRRLMTAFSKLRRSKCWKTWVEGGAAVPETKIGEDGLWHHHVHIIATGQYLPQDQLSDAWLKATGDSRIVDIQDCKDLQARVWYITKYVTKPIDATILGDEGKLVEFINAIKGTRAFNVFGNWTSDKVDHTDGQNMDWKPICSVVQLMKARDAGEEWARGLASQLQRELANLPPAAGP